MAWGELRKEDLAKVGLDPDAIKTTLDGLDDKIKNAVTEGNKVNTESLAAIQQSLAALQNKINEQPNKGGDEGKGRQEERQQEEAPDWMLEPEKATTALVDKKLGGLAVTMATMRAETNYANFKSTSPRGFNQFEAEIKEMWGKQSLQARQNPELLENIHKIVLGNHIDEVAAKGKEFFIENTGGGSSRGVDRTNDPKAKPEDKLSKDELEIATKWGISAEDYLKEKESRGVTTYA